MDNATIIAAVKAWQARSSVHPLTCGVHSAHRVLQPVEEEEQVVLRCPDRHYRQASIPRLVIEEGMRAVDSKDGRPGKVNP